MSERWQATGEPTALELIDRRAERMTNEPFLTVTDRAMTAAELAEGTWGIGSFLASVGVRKGDRVATFLENVPEAVTALFGAFRCGAIVIPVNSALRGSFLAHVLADSGATVMITQSDFMPRVLEILREPGISVRHVVVIDAPATGGAGESYTLPESVTGWSWSDALECGAPRPSVSVGRGDAAVCLYTGGTTGLSKGCVLSQNALVYHGVQSQNAYGRRPDDIFFTPLPLFHVNAIKFGVLGTLAIGGRAVITRRFSVSQFWPEIAKHKATIAGLLGSMATLIARSENEKQGDSLRLIAAIPLPVEDDRTLRRRFGLETYSGAYGMTECSGIGRMVVGMKNKPGAAGLANTEAYDVRILDDDDNEVPPGESGEIVARPRIPNIIFQGYWNRPADTLAVLRDLWFHTGDIGKIDDDGYLYFVDRKKDYLRRRGENISSVEVETELRKHPEIADLAVHAVKSEIVEDEVKVTAVRKPASGLSEEEFFRWMIERLPYFALPAYIEFRDELPRSAVGRVLKRELRDEGLTPATWSREKAGVTFERR